MSTAPLAWRRHEELHALIHDRLKAKPYKQGCDPDIAWRQVKLDGHRLTLFKQADNRLIAFGRDDRTHLEMSKQLEHLEWFRRLRGDHTALPRISSLDCELHAIGERASQVPRLLLEKSPKLLATAFAVPFWAGEPLPEESLYKTGSLVTDRVKMPWAFCHSHLDSDTLPPIPKDAEGWVLKAANYRGWWKVKEERTVDAFVTGFKEGKGKHDGFVGALIVSVWKKGQELSRKAVDARAWLVKQASLDHNIINPESITTIANVSGMSDEVRWDIDEDRDLWRPCEVKYQLVDAGGRLRHPRFVRWRDDKPLEECGEEQLELSNV